MNVYVDVYVDVVVNVVVDVVVLLYEPPSVDLPKRSSCSASRAAVQGPRKTLERIVPMKTGLIKA